MMSDRPKKHFRNLDDFSGMASDWFWETDADHRFCYFSRRMEEVTKFDISALIGKKRDVIPNEDLSDPKWVQHMDDLAHHRPFRNFEYEMRRPHDKTLFWIRIAGEPQFDEDGKFLGYRGTGHDITHEKVAMQRLEDSNAKLAARNHELDNARQTIERIAYTDALTDLANRRSFERDLEHALSEATGLLGLLHVDLDRFKWVNDTLGHPAGDQVLQSTAKRLRLAAGNDGTVYRVGGDEFTIIISPLASEEFASWLGDAVVSAMEAPIRIAAQQVTVGASVGVALAQSGEHDAASLASHADAALYEAKRSGRNTVRLSTPELQLRIDDERRLSFDIPAAIENREFVPFFQPQVDTVLNKVIGAEALVRWQHPERGLLTPDVFLRAATELGRIDQIDSIILEDSLKALERLKSDGYALPALSVNVSEARLVDPELCNDIERLWKNKDCQLTIELLETVNFDESSMPNKFNENLQRLRHLGVRLETDDFGSGRASITGLLLIAPDGIKIDRDLIKKVVKSPKQRSVVRGILEIASALDIDCIAEGVETLADIEAIVALGCSRFQGYAIAKPMSEQDLANYLFAQIERTDAGVLFDVMQPSSRQKFT